MKRISPFGIAVVLVLVVTVAYADDHPVDLLRAVLCWTEFKPGLLMPLLLASYWEKMHHDQRMRSVQHCLTCQG